MHPAGDGRTPHATAWPERHLPAHRFNRNRNNNNNNHRNNRNEPREVRRHIDEGHDQIPAPPPPPPPPSANNNPPRLGRRRSNLSLDDHNFPALGAPVADVVPCFDNFEQLVEQNSKTEEEEQFGDDYLHVEMVERPAKSYRIQEAHFYDEERIDKDRARSLLGFLRRQPSPKAAYRCLSLIGSRREITLNEEKSPATNGRGGEKPKSPDIDWDSMLPDEGTVYEFYERGKRAYAVDSFGPSGREEFDREKAGMTDVGRMNAIKVERHEHDPLRRVLLSAPDKTNYQRELEHETMKYGREGKEKELAKQIEIAIPNTNLSLLLGSGGVPIDVLETWSGGELVAAKIQEGAGPPQSTPIPIPGFFPPPGLPVNRRRKLGGFADPPPPRARLPVNPPPVYADGRGQQSSSFARSPLFYVRYNCLPEKEEKSAQPEKFTSVVVHERDIGQFRKENAEGGIKWRKEKQHKTAGLIHLDFERPEAAAAAVERHPSIVKPAPRELLLGGREECAIALKETTAEFTWKRRPMFRVSVFMQSATVKERRYATDIFSAHEFYIKPVKADRSFSYEAETTACLLLTIPAGGFHTDDEELAHIKEIIAKNKITVDPNGVRPQRAQEQLVNDKVRIAQLKDGLNHRLFEIVQELGYWGDVSYGMVRQKYQVPWRIQVQNERISAMSGYNKATVYFEQGILTEALEKNLEQRCEGFPFKLYSEDRKGVRLSISSRIVLVMSRALRALYHEELVELGVILDDERRIVHHSVTDNHSQWAVLHDVTADQCKECIIRDDECALEIIGVPMSYLASTAARVSEIMNGMRIDCTQGVGRRWLLTGFGRELAERVAAKAMKTQVIIDFNLIAMAITLFGRDTDCLHVHDELRTIAKNRKNHILKTSLPVCWPLYLDKTGNALSFATLQKVQRIIGGNIHLHPEQPNSLTLVFEGSLGAYEDLRNYIDRLDDKLRSSSERELRLYGFSPENDVLDPNTPIAPPVQLCPVCMCRVPDNFYCLAACGHFYCMDCLAHQVSSQLQTRALPLTCLHEGCGAELAIADIIRLLLGDCEGRLRGRDAVKLTPLVRAAVAALIRKGGDVFPCRRPGCEGIFKHKKRAYEEETSDETNVAEEEPSNVTYYDELSSDDEYPPFLANAEHIVACSACSLDHCGDCGLEPHDEPCELYKKLRVDVDASLQQWLGSLDQDAVRICPNQACAVVIEKEIGCNHMECVFCKTHFCWICCFSSNKESDIYKHMSEVHGGTGGGWMLIDGEVVHAPPDEMDDGLLFQQALMQNIRQ